MSNVGVVAIIPARGGSKRLPRKNIYPFFGRPLLEYTIKACQQSARINQGVYVSTDDADIARIARSLGALVIERPTYLGADSVWTQEVLRHAVDYLEGSGVNFEAVARIHCSPEVQSAKIDEAVDKLTTHDLWEVFSVNQLGIEDAVIHVLRKHCVRQQALSVYKGTVATTYTDIHTLADIIALEKQKIDMIDQASGRFLRQLERRHNHDSWRDELRYVLGRPRYLWQWQLKIPLWQRWQTLLDTSQALRDLLYSPNNQARRQQLRVLDLGSGFGMYWPILREFGVRHFVGVDLFDIRGQETYYQAAQEYVQEFCPDCATQLIMDDVRNLGNHQLLFPQFDLILNVATVSTKAGSTGIPYSLFQKIVKKYGTHDCIEVHAESVH